MNTQIVIEFYCLLEIHIRETNRPIKTTPWLHTLKPLLVFHKFSFSTSQHHQDVIHMAKDFFILLFHAIPFEQRFKLYMFETANQVLMPIGNEEPHQGKA